MTVVYFEVRNCQYFDKEVNCFQLLLFPAGISTTCFTVLFLAVFAGILFDSSCSWLGYSICNFTKKVKGVGFVCLTLYLPFADPLQIVRFKRPYPFFSSNERAESGTLELNHVDSRRID